MFDRKMTYEEQAIQAEAQKILDAMQEYGPESPEYPILIERYKALNDLRLKKSWTVSPDTVLIVAGNLIGILIIVAYEQKNVLTTKALNFSVKPKDIR